MSNTPIYAPTSSPTERRSHVRQKLAAVVYLDIGTDNGGIAVDLSEEGAGVQAVGPLTERTDVVLRIQLPNSQRPIETPAQIAWVRESHRFAGIRFVDMPPEARARIQECISSQLAPPEQVLRPPQAAERPERNERAAPRHHKDKWLSLLSESEKSQQQISNLPATTAGADPPPSGPPARETSATPPAPPDISSGDRGRAAALSSEARPQRQAPRSAISKLGPRVQPSTQIDANSTLAAPPKRGGAFDRLIQKPAPASSAPPTSARAPSAPRPALGSTAARVSVVESKKFFLPAAKVPAPSSPEADRGDRAWTWFGVVCLFAVLAALSFLVGRSVGTLARRAPLTPVPESPAVAMQTSQPAPGQSPDLQKRAEGSHAAARRVGAEHGERDLVPYRASPAPTPPISNQTASLLAPTAPKLQENAVVAQPQQPLNPPQVAQPAQSSSAMPPAIDDSAGAASPPIVIAGRTLSPMDRFNPAHLTYRFDPEYPPAAREQGIQGIVELRLLVAPNGTVRSVKVLSGAPLLVPAAVAAAKDWRYLPALLNGEPIETEQDAKIEFHLPQ
jgi:TonB family protein